MNEQLYFHIGFHKTGSTWLQTYLFSNKEYFNLMNNFSQPWDDEILSYLVKCHLSDFDPNYLQDLVLSRVNKNKINIISAERLSGHPSSGGFDSDSISKKIYLSFPDAKIIVVSRDYDSFKISAYKQVVKEGYLGEFINFNDNAAWKKSSPSDFYFNHDNIIKIYKNRFDNVLELSFDKLRKDKSSFLELISKFCERKIKIQNSEKMLNKTYTNKRIRALRFLNKFRKTEFNLCPIISINEKFIFKLSFLFSWLFLNKKIN